MNLIFQTAEKRKKLLDELAIKSQEDSESYKSKLAQLEATRKEELSALTSTHKSEVSELMQALKAEQVCIRQHCESEVTSVCLQSALSGYLLNG